MYVCMHGHTYSKSKDQLGKVANPARGQLNRKNEYFPLLVRSLRIWSRETRLGSPVPRQPAHLHTQAESGAYIRDSSRVPRRRPLMYYASIRHRVSPEFIGSVPSLPDHAIAYRWRLLPRVRRHRVSKPRGSVPTGCCLGKSPWTN